MVNNKNLTEIEYYMTKKDRTDWTQAEYDIRDGILRICDVPFEYRSLSLYRKGYRKCFIDCFEISRPREIAKEAAPLEKQILEDIAECEARYQRSGNLSKEYPWYLLKARMYCLKRLYQEGVIDGLFKKEIQLLASQMYFLKTNFQTIVWHLLRKNIISASRMMITIEH